MGIRAPNCADRVPRGPETADPTDRPPRPPDRSLDTILPGLNAWQAPGARAGRRTYRAATTSISQRAPMARRDTPTVARVGGSTGKYSR